MTLDDFLEQLREEGGDAVIMADKISLLDQLIGTAMRGTNIIRKDGMAPFAAVVSKDDPTVIQTIYLPIDTVVSQIIGPALQSAVAYITEKKFERDHTEYKSVITKEPLEPRSYAEGMIDCMVGLSMAITETLEQARMIIIATMEHEAKEAINPTGDKELDTMARASALINQAPKKTIH